MPTDPTRNQPQIIDREQQLIELDPKVQHLLEEIERIKENPGPMNLNKSHPESIEKMRPLMDRLAAFEASLDLKEKGMDILEEGHLILFLHQLKKEIQLAMGQKSFNEIHDKIDAFLKEEGF